MKTEAPANIQFLTGGGEMGELIRAKDWSQTSIGDPGQWPQSLLTTLSILLNSKFPMFLWWGADLVQFYNDAYRPSLGNSGKHPAAIGQKGEDCWPEIWPTIKPLMDKVLQTGESTWSENQLIPIFRNGQMEDVYWTFSYSPVKDENGAIGGILVVCNETTSQMLGVKKLETSELQFRDLIKEAPIATSLFTGPEFIIEIANREALELWGKNNSIIGKKIIEAIPELSGQPYIQILENVYKTGETYYGNENLAYLHINGMLQPVYVNFIYKALRNVRGQVWAILCMGYNVTEQIEARKKLEDSEARTRMTVEAAMLGTFDLDIRTYEIDASKRFCAIFGFENSNISYADVIKAIHPDDLHIRDEANSQAIIKGYVNYEVRILWPDKTIHWINILGKLFFDENKGPLRLLGTVMDITDAIVSKHLLEESEERLRLATDATGLATWELDLQTNNIIHAPRLAEIFGHNKSIKLSHQAMLSQVHPDDLHAIIEPAFNEALQTGIYRYEARVIKSDNVICWISTKGKVYYDEEKKPVKLIGTIRDITEEKNHQQELFESEQTFRLLADSMPQFIWTGDAEGNLNYYNQSVFDYSGLTLEQINKDGWLQIVHPDDREENIRIWIDSVTTGKDFLFEHRFRRHDGVYRWQLSRATPQKDANGNIQMWVGTSTDIEDQKTFAKNLETQVQEQIRQIKLKGEELIKIEERYHLMVDEVQDYAILFLNSNGIVENWNKGAKKIKGYDADEIIGKSFSVFYTEEDRQNHLPETLLNKARQTGKALQEGWRVRKDGTLFWASVVITALHNEQNDIVGFSKVTRDLTERRNAEEKVKAHAAQLEQKNKELEKINAELKSFAYVSSHDLQEPLRKIQTFSSSILEKEEQNLSEKGKDYFNRIQQSAARMQTLIEDLLSYSRTSIAERVFVNTDLNEIVNEVKNDFAEVLAEKHATIDAHEMCSLNIIPFQFRQLLHNLISNSLKFSKPGIQPYISIVSEIVKGDKLDMEMISPQKKYCHIIFSDNGIGFDPVYKERIFDIFQRLHGRNEYKGTGIGLAIVKKIVENHNGFITTTGQIDKGATFDIYIPA